MNDELLTFLARVEMAERLAAAEQRRRVKVYLREAAEARDERR